MKKICLLKLREEDLPLKGEGKLQFCCPAVVSQLLFIAPSRRFAFQSSVKKICLLKRREKDLPFKAPCRRFAFESCVKKICLLKLREEDLALKAP